MLLAGSKCLLALPLSDSLLVNGFRSCAVCGEDYRGD
jgi:hypothetical protein